MTPPAAHLEVGREGERTAARYLEGRGWKVVGHGFRARRGEIDLLCRDGDRLVVVEVKARSSDRFGSPALAVGRRKRRALAAAVAEYRLLAGWRGPIDFAIVTVTPGGVELLEDLV